MHHKEMLGRVFILCSSSILLVTSFQIDNEITGNPVVDCEDTMVSLTFETKKPFTGRVYVRGLADDDRCSRSFTDNDDQSRFSMMVQTGDCTMQRQRVTGNIEGIMFSLTIVVSFHGTFVTKVDRAYRCMCFFRNVKHLTSAIDMQPIQASELMNTAQMPKCTYSIHNEAPNGPQVVYGAVGEKIYHVWECDNPEYGFLVHSCFVNDGRSMRFDLLDIDGCAIDPVIQPDVEYNADLTKAIAETWGYKFSDTSILNYQCVVELCKKSTGECDGLTPPACQREKRSSKRIKTSRLKRYQRTKEFDLSASVQMLDSLKEDGLYDSKKAEIIKRVEQTYREPVSQISLVPKDHVCFAYKSLSVFLALTVLLVILLFITVSLLLRETKSRK